MPATPETSVHDLRHGEGEVRFEVTDPHGDQATVHFWGDIPASETAPIEAALAATLLSAMGVGGKLSLPGPLSPQLRRALPDIQAVLKTIAAAAPQVERPLRDVGVVAPQPDAELTELPRSAPGAGLFFSGGIDSWSALISDPTVTDLVYVHGFDIPLAQTEASAIVERRLGDVADEMGKAFRVVRTDLRELLDAHVAWELSHGPALAAVALLMAPAVGRMEIGSTAPYAALTPVGSHPLHDHLWSTERCRIEHRGANMTRAEKIAQVATRQDALDVLRVCWRRVDLYNCGRCEKCLRTMAALDAVGALERCPTFAEPLDLGAVAALRLDNPVLPPHWRGTLQLAREQDARPELIAAIEAALEVNEERNSESLEGQLAAAEAQAKALEGELRTVVSSRSWRLTAPLRRVGSTARRRLRERPPKLSRSSVGPQPPPIFQRVRADRLTYLDNGKVANLETCIEDVNREYVPGDFLEAGVALGGSAIAMASSMGNGRTFHGYDVFEQIPPPSERDKEDAHSRFAVIAQGRSEGLGGDLYYGYVDDLYSVVVGNFEHYGLRVDGGRICLHKGLLEDTFFPKGPVALAHIDCDWHDPVMLCLERAYPLLSPGGYIVLDDYNDYSGCRIATDSFLAAHEDLEIVKGEPNLVLRRRSR